jgi:hypothetical protein
MSEYEIHRLIIETRTEFDFPTYLFPLVSLAYIAVAIMFARATDVISDAIGVISVRLALAAFSVSYIIVSVFIYIREEAARTRFARALGVLRQQNVDPDSAWDILQPLQGPTGDVRAAVFVVVGLLTLLALLMVLRAHWSRSQRPVPARGT